MLSDRVRRPSIPARIFTIELDGSGSARSDIGAAPSSAAHDELDTYVEIAMLHAAELANGRSLIQQLPGVLGTGRSFGGGAGGDHQ